MNRAAALPIVDGEITDLTCVTCGYDLRGLPHTGACPECGTGVERSLQGTWLLYSSPEYVAELHRGVWLIVTGVLVKALLVFLTIGINLGVAAAAPGLVGSLTLGINLVGLGVSAATLWGWWLFSEPDPRYTGRDDGSTARKVVRVSVVVSAAVSLVSAFTTLLPRLGMHSEPIMALIVIAGIAGVVAWAAQFFASMLYLRWLAPRLPDAHTAGRARTLMWACPLLSTVGVLLLGLGPLIALVLYWNLLDHVRKLIKAIRAEQSAVGV